MVNYLILMLAVCSFLWKPSFQDNFYADSNQILSLLRLVHARSLEHRAHMQRMETLMKEILESGKGDEALEQSITFLKNNLELMVTKIAEIENKISKTTFPVSQKPHPEDVPSREDSQLLLDMQNTLRSMDQKINSLQNRIPSRDSQSFSIDAINLIMQNHMNRLEQNIYRKIENAEKHNKHDNPSSSVVITGNDVKHLIQEAFNTGTTSYSAVVELIFDRKLHSLETVLQTFCTQGIQQYNPQRESPLELTAHRIEHRPGEQMHTGNQQYIRAGIDIVSPPNPKEYVEVGKKLKPSSTYNRSYLKNYPRDCVDIFNLGMKKTGIYEAFVEHDGQSIPVYCDMDVDGGGWTVVLRRDSSENPHVNFDRPWPSYKNGFGSLNGEFWLGNKYIHALTSRTVATVRIEIIDNLGRHGFAEYEGLRIHGENQKYLLHVGTFTKGNIPDELSSHNGTYFSTPEEDNDRHPGRNCGETFFGGWWFDNCFRVYLNGQHVLPLDSKAIRGIYWGFRFPGNQRLQGAEIKIRSVNFRRSYVSNLK